jgi:hypothetical protein
MVTGVQTCALPIYIGKTVRSLDARWKQHLHDAARGSKVPLHAAMRKHGADAFHLSEIASIEIADRKITNRLLNNLETNLIREYGTYHGGGYNATPGGDGYAKGMKLALTDDQRKRRAERMKTVPISGPGPLNGMFGKKHRPETIENMKGPKSESARLHMSEAKKGKPTWASTHRDIATQKAVAAVRGKAKTEEHRKKISESRMGRFTGEDNPFFGKHHSEATRAKMKLARARRRIAN